MSDIIQKLGITPGPWEWRKHNGLNSSALFYSDDFSDTILDDGSAHDEYGQKIDPEGANARLVAAAPEMLEALINICLAIEEFVSTEYEDIKEYESIKIIEKATGKTWQEIKALNETS